MALRRTLTQRERQELKSAMKAARTPGELRRHLCAWLYFGLGLNAAQTAAAVGWHVAGAYRALNCYRRSGVSALKDRELQPLAAPEGGGAAWRTALRRAGSLEEFRLVQCVALRARLGLDAGQVARAVGWSRGAVGRVQCDYLRRGAAALTPFGTKPLEPGFAARLRTAMKKARNVPVFRRAQCVYMRAALGLSATLVARILGWSRNSVGRLYQDYLRQGDEVLRAPGRGGKRWRVLSRLQEAKVLRAVRNVHGASTFLPFPLVQKAVEAKAGRPVNPAYVQSILDRHGWSRDALVISPRRGRPRAAASLPEDDDLYVDANEIDRMRAESWRFWGGT